MEKTYDFCGWATKSNIPCSDGLTIAENAFKDCDGLKVPLVWNHRHNDPTNILGHAMLECRDGGVYAYCSFNETENGKTMKQAVLHGDIVSLSICANELKKQSKVVQHGKIREVSLVIAPANPKAMIDQVIYQADGSMTTVEDEGIIYTGEPIELYHAEEAKSKEKPDDDKVGEKTVQDVIDTMNDEQKVVLYSLLDDALSGEMNPDDEENKEEDSTMKHNVFDKETEKENVLTHSDQEKILMMAKSSNYGTLKTAMAAFAESDDTLKHSFEPDSIAALFPDYKDVRPGAPELITNEVNNSWVNKVMSKVHKSPISRIRTRQADARNASLEAELRAFGYKKGTLKQNIGNIKLVSRTTDPQTVYVKDYMNRDDKLDITDFDVVAYIQHIMRLTLNEELATAIMIGDHRDSGDPQKIEADKIRPIWGDDALYVIYSDVDKDAMATELQGDNADDYFGENFIYAEAVIQEALYAREQYRGSGSLDFYCDPHLVNVMLLSRDRNGHRMYKDISDLRAALNVNEIITVEQFANKTRTVGAKTKKLLGIFVNLADYQVGATKGGEITSFNDFDIDFNQEKYLIETRLSGALTRVKSAIVLEEDVTPSGT
jgi:hypothetical protein